MSRQDGEIERSSFIVIVCTERPLLSEIMQKGKATQVQTLASSSTAAKQQTRMNQASHVALQAPPDQAFAAASSSQHRSSLFFVVVEN